MIEVIDTLLILDAELAFPWNRFALLDQVEEHQGSSISLEEVSKMSCRGGVERIHNADCADV